MAIRILPGAHAIQIRKVEHEAPGGWLQAREPQSTRDRKGLHLVGQLTSLSAYAAGSAYYSETSRVLSPWQLWKLYLTTPDIRACIDSIVRRIATWQWLAEPTADPDSADYEEAEELAATVQRFMSSPTQDPLISVWQEFATAFGTDLLVFDAGCAELVKSPDGVLREMVPLRGCDIFPKMTPLGQVESWRQFIYEAFGAGIATRLASASKSPEFALDEILFMRLFSNTTTPLGLPLIDTIVNEAVSLIVQSDHARLTLDADEIPPGMLVLGGLAKEAAARARADLRHLRGKDHKIRVVTSSTTTGVSAEWIEFRRTPKDVGMMDVVKEIRHTVWRTFGVMRVEMGETDGMPRATATAQLDVSSSHLINPILELLQAKLTSRVVPMIVADPEADEEENARRAGLVRFRFDLDAAQTPEELALTAEADERYVRNGILTRNEVRARLGNSPIDGGDVATVEEGGLLVPVAALARRTGEQNPDTGGGADGTPKPKPPAPSSDGTDDQPADQEPGPGEVAQGESSTTRNPAQRDAPRGLQIDLIQAISARAGLADLIDDLPSAWEKPDVKPGGKTLDLPRLAAAVSGYARDIDAAWGAMAEQVLSILGAEYQPGIDAAAATRMVARCEDAIDVLASRWSNLSEPHYRTAAKIGHDAVAEMAGPGLVESWPERADRFATEALAYLVGEDGPIVALKDRILANTEAVTAGAVRTKDYTPPLELVPGTSAGDFLRVCDAAMEAQRYRVDNWSGKLVELSNDVMFEGLSESMSIDANLQWFAEWLCLFDEASCRDCRHWGRLGRLPLNNFTTRPAGDVRCGARCRCAFSIFAEATSQP